MGKAKLSVAPPARRGAFDVAPLRGDVFAEGDRGESELSMRVMSSSSLLFVFLVAGILGPLCRYTLFRVRSMLACACMIISFLYFYK